MADLDSFFAKKEKKKVKGMKFTNKDEIAKRLEEKEKKHQLKEVQQKPLDQTFLASDSGTDKSTDNKKNYIVKKSEEDEWEDFREKNNDLSDLKISKLQIENDDDGTGGYGEGEDGERGSVGAHNQEGVWKVKADQAPAQPQQLPVEELPASEEPKKIGSYIPPHLKQQQVSSHLKRSTKPKVAPDITNEMAFPSLGAQPPPPPQPVGALLKPSSNVQHVDDRDFESVRHGSAARPMQTLDNVPKISTANKFDVLRDS